MSKPIEVSICLSDLKPLMESGHSAFQRSKKNQKMYVSVNVWVNETADKFGNNVSLTLRSTKGGRDGGEKKVYIGNGKIGAQNSSGGGWSIQNDNPAPAAGHNDPNNTPGGGSPWNPNKDDEGLPF